MKIRTGLLISAFLTLAPAQAFADYVRSPEVEAGEFEIHNISILENDSKDHFENELELAYGLNDWLEVELGLVSEKSEHKSMDYFTGAELAFKFELAKEGEYMPATALYTSYEYTEEQGKADEVSIMAILEKNIGKLENTINLQLASQVGGGAEGGLEFGIKARSTYEICEKLALGAEYFGNFGQIDDRHSWSEQGHQLGPVVTYDLTEHTHASLAYLAGISEEAPESAIKLELGFHF